MLSRIMLKRASYGITFLMREILQSQQNLLDPHPIEFPDICSMASFHGIRFTASDSWQTVRKTKLPNRYNTAN